ncbi:MAG: hypothetical protein KA956_06915 [Pyrinomonadaceae bacterium]|nr:hypothetical protein [Acidobacteriota bacterium]MBK7935147.1 hypothetical protein [Acidobacteriota bacterium]MBP7376191.1 hypothetical protein [Pyrinomonadaceae bacterium]
MWKKLFLAILGISSAVMAFFTYYSWSWLNSVGRPADAVSGYEYHSGLACTVIAVSGVVLIALANGVLWATQRAWAIWVTFTYVAFFLIVRYFWLGEIFFRFNSDNGLTNSNYSFGPVFGVILILICGVMAFANQFISVRLYQKMYQASSATSSEPEPMTNDGKVGGEE